MNGFKSHKLSLSGIFFIFTLLVINPAIKADPVEVILEVIDTSMSPGETEAYISVYFDNYFDTIA